MVTIESAAITMKALCVPMAVPSFVFVVAAWADATIVETTEVPIAPASCWSVLMTAFPSPLLSAGR